MNLIALDTETCLFRPGCMAPELVCMTWANNSGSGLYHHTDTLPLVEEWLRHPNVRLVGHNMPYDAAVLCAAWPHLTKLFFDAYDADRITDTKIREQLIDIAKGQYRGTMGADGVWRKWGYTLLEVAKKRTGVLLEKDEWRLRYGELIHTPVAEWPEGARKYATDDAIATYNSAVAQEVDREFLDDQYRQSSYAFALHLMSCWGLRTRPSEVAALEQRTTEAYLEMQAHLVEEGLVRANGVRDTKAASARMLMAMGDRHRKTPAGAVCLDEDACEASEDDVLIEYGKLTKQKTVLAKDIPALKQGQYQPIHSSFGLAETTRTTSSKPNVQNWGRDGDARACFVPRPGRVYMQADFDQLELHTLAQVQVALFGQSALADILNSKRQDGSWRDPHTELAASILKIDLETAYARKKDKSDKEFINARQTAKAANFALPGGLGIKKFVLFARKTYGVVLTEERATEIKREWMLQWPEMQRYFAYIRGLETVNNAYVVEHPFVGRLRSGATYTAACNSLFQGLGADCAKRALWLVQRACYSEPSNPLYGSRIVNFVHDELIGETDDGPSAHYAATEMARLMLEGANKYLPDVPCKTEPVLMRYWSKNAIQVFDTNHRLVPWEG